MAQLQMLYSEWLDQDLVGWIQVSYGLRTFNTLSQDREDPDYKINIYICTITTTTTTNN